jgi:hypothetical protein
MKKPAPSAPKKATPPATPKAEKKLPPAAAKAKALAARLKPPPLADSIVATSTLLSGLSIVLALCLLIYLGVTERRDRLYAYNSSGPPSQLQYADTPNISSEALINWCKMVVGELFTYNFNDVYQRMDAAFGYFTPRGWDSFAAAFMASDVFNRTQAQRIFVSTLPSGIASVIEEGDVNGRYTWTVQLAAVTRIYSGTSQLENNTISMVVEKVPTNNSLTGYPFGIVKITR